MKKHYEKPLVIVIKIDLDNVLMSSGETYVYEPTTFVEITEEFPLDR